MCKQLLAAGVDPATPLHAYRGDVLALRVLNIGEAARLCVKVAGNGTPIFAPAEEGAGASPDDHSTTAHLNVGSAKETRR
jgi:hypothetical protein